MSEEKTFSSENFTTYIKDIASYVEKVNNMKFKYVDIDRLCDDIINNMADNMTSDEIMNLSMDIAYGRVVYEPEYEYIASGIAWYSHHKTIDRDPINILKLLYNNVNPLNGRKDNNRISQTLVFCC